MESETVHKVETWGPLRNATLHVASRVEGAETLVSSMWNKMNGGGWIRTSDLAIMSRVA